MHAKRFPIICALYCGFLSKINTQRKDISNILKNDCSRIVSDFIRLRVNDKFFFRSSLKWQIIQIKPCNLLKRWKWIYLCFTFHPDIFLLEILCIHLCIGSKLNILANGNFTTFSSKHLENISPKMAIWWTW